MARRVIVTTNYDLSIERAAELNGIPFRTPVPAELGELFRGEIPEGTLVVVHLHGHTNDLGSIVLTESSYSRAFSDLAIEMALRQFAASNVLVFLGHRLADTENHLYRDLGEVTRAFDQPVVRTRQIASRTTRLRTERHAPRWSGPRWVTRLRARSRAAPDAGPLVNGQADQC